MTNTAKAVVWDAVWLPFGGVQAVSGVASLNARFPGQWFQAETGLHYNWHRSYDPSLGRYTQVDPLGFVDGPNVFNYAAGSPQTFVDKDGRLIQFLIPIIVKAAAGAAAGDLVFQYFYRRYWRGDSAQKSLKCLNIVSPIYSGLAGAFGASWFRIMWRLNIMPLRFGPV